MSLYLFLDMYLHSGEYHVGTVGMFNIELRLKRYQDSDLSGYEGDRQPTLIIGRSLSFVLNIPSLFL